MRQETNSDNLALTGEFKLAGLRWWIIGLVFLATLINYIDRLTISILAPVITQDLGLTNTAFGSIAAWFLLAYTFSQAVSGRLYDRIGIKRGFACSIVVWSLAALAHAFARGLTSLSALRFVLGLGEAGNWPGAAKTVAEWFPVRQRALGMALFNSGAALGSILAPPLIVWLQISYGWQTTFLVTGTLGFIWLALWWFFYDEPERHPWLRAEERALIRADEDTPGKNPPAPGWLQLLTYRQVWGLVLGRFCTDPVWWLYITWLPLYLYQVRGFNLKQIGLFAWLPYVAADVGSLFGGGLAGWLIGRGWTVDAARKSVIIGAALLMPAGIAAAFVGNAMLSLGLISVVLFGFQVWINNVQTLPSDFFPKQAVGSVAGLGGMGAGIGSMLFIFATGWVVDRFSYTPILVAAGLLAPLGTIVLLALAGKIQQIETTTTNTEVY